MKCQSMLRLRDIWGFRHLRLAAGLVISALSIWLAVRNVSFDEVGAALGQADLALVLLALASIGVNILGKALRWKVILGPEGQPVGTGKAAMAIVAGQALNYLYPARMGDLSRAIVIGGMGPGRVFTLGTILVEKLVDMLAYSFLFVVLLLLIPVPGWLSSSSYGLALVSVLMLVGVFVVAYRLEAVTGLLRRLLASKLFAWLPGRLTSGLEQRLEAGLSSLNVLQSRGDLLKIGLLSGLIWGTALLNNQIALWAMGIHLPLGAALLLLIVLQASVSVPTVVPAGVGLYEYLCILSLALFDVPQAEALAFGILLHTLTAGTTILLGVIFLFPLGLFGKTGPKKPAHEPDNKHAVDIEESEPGSQEIHGGA